MYGQRESPNAKIYKVGQVAGIERIFQDIDNEPQNKYEECQKALWLYYRTFKQVFLVLFLKKIGLDLRIGLNKNYYCIKSFY